MLATQSEGLGWHYCFDISVSAPIDSSTCINRTISLIINIIVSVHIVSNSISVGQSFILFPV